MKANFRTAGLLVLVCAISACETGQKKLSITQPPVIDLPFKREIVKYADFTFMPSEGGTFTTEKGTRLQFPADAFAFEDGSKVTEPVTVKFREYHTASEIMLSGIRMTAKDENGDEYPFESAGMFDIDGFCGTKKIKVAEGKRIQIDLASMKKDPDFNFYKLGEQGWTELQENVEAGDNSIKVELQEATRIVIPEKPIEPQKFDKDEFVFDVDIDTRRNPELKELYGLMWQYNGPEGSKTDPNTNKDITEKAWTNSYLNRIGDGNFMLTLSNKKETLSIPVKPVMSQSNYEAAQKRFEEKMAGYDQALARKEEAKKKIDRAYTYTRSLSLSGFGIYNCDRFYKIPTKTVEPEYTTTKGSLPEGSVIFMIAKEDIVIRMYDYSVLTYNPLEKNRLVAILPDERVLAIGAAEFKQYAGDENFRFQFKEIPIPNVNAETLGDVIKSI